jgi:hypothetical protein
MGWQDDPVVSGGGWQDDPIVDEKNPRTLGESALRAGGLGVRDVAEGLMSLPNIMGNAANTGINMGLRGLDRVNSAITGQNAPIPQYGLPSEATTKLLTRAGLPVPETGPEQFASSINRAVVGFSPMQAGANAVTGAAKSLPFINSMLTKPVSELATVATGAGASDLTRQAGGGEIAQAVAGMVAPLAINSAVGVTKRAASGINELRRPVTARGQDQIAADFMGRVTTDKGAALKNLERYNQLVAKGATVGVPGSLPTAGAVAGDYGLIGAQQAISRGDASADFAKQFAKNNEARAADLSKLNATDKMVEFYEKKRWDKTSKLRDEAFDNATGPVDYGPVALKLGEVAGTAAGGRAEPQRALSWIAKRLDEYNGTPGRNDARNAYALHQDIGDLIAGKIADEKGAIRLSAGLANDVKKSLAAQIEAVAPGFKKYMEAYSRLSKPIDRLDVIRQRLGGEDLSQVTNAMPQLTPDGATFTVSQAKMKNELANINAETSLAPRQRDVLERVLGDLNSETVALRGGKQPGSDTYQNLASANLVNRVLGQTLGESGLGKTVARPLNFAYKPFEAKINDLIAKAFQDPKEMERLLRLARTSRGSPTLAGLLNSAGEKSSAGLLGSLFAQ